VPNESEPAKELEPAKRPVGKKRKPLDKGALNGNAISGRAQSVVGRPARKKARREKASAPSEEDLPRCRAVPAKASEPNKAKRFQLATTGRKAKCQKRMCKI